MAVPSHGRNAGLAVNRGDQPRLRWIRVKVNGSRDGTSYSAQQIHVVYFRDGKVAKSWLFADDQAAVDQLLS